jgi:uncharacterized OsmC-like protein
MFATVFGSFLPSSRVAATLSALVAASAASAASTARRDRITLECWSTGTGGEPIGFRPAAMIAARRSSLACCRVISRRRCA